MRDETPAREALDRQPIAHDLAAINAKLDGLAARLATLDHAMARALGAWPAWWWMPAAVKGAAALAFAMLAGGLAWLG